MIFEKDGKRFLETFPHRLFPKQLAYQLPLENLKRFTEKAILRLGGAFIPSGDIIQTTVPPALKKYPDVASSYENVSFSRKTATGLSGSFPQGWEY